MTVMPRTLLQLADASLKPAAPQNSVLLMIDVQNEYVAGSLVLSGVDAALEQGRALLALARRHGVPVCHVLHHGTPGRGPFDPHSRLGEPVDGFTPAEGEHVVIKSKPNAFTGTGLDAWLRETGRTELLIGGFMTHMCVASTTIGALDLGYRTTVIADATATRDLPDAQGGGIIRAEALRRAVLAGLADRFAVVVPDTAALAACWQEG